MNTIEVTNQLVDGNGKRTDCACFGCAVRNCCPIRSGLHQMDSKAFIVTKCDYHVARPSDPRQLHLGLNH